MQRALIAVPIAAVSVVALAGSANAHYVYERAELWVSGNGKHCMTNRSEVSHGTDNRGYAKGDVTSWMDLNSIPTDCQHQYKRPAGHLRDGIAIYKWNGTDWYKCKWTTEWFANTSNTAKFELEWPAKDLSWGCGEGWYGTMNFATMTYNAESIFPNGVPGLWSGAHSGLKGISEEPPPPPDWVDDDGVATPEATPDKVEIVDSEGRVVIGDDGKPVKVDTAPESPTEANTTYGGKRSTSTDEEGNVTETAEIGLTSPVASSSTL